MADRYWVGGSASWDGTAGAKWATTSGGAGGAAVPTSSDAVFFDAASGSVTVTVTATANAASINLTGFTGTLDTNGQTVNAGFLQSTGTAARTLTLGASTVNLSGSSAISFSGSNFTFNAGTSTINAAHASCTIAGNGLTFATVNLTATAAGTRTISGANTFGALNITNGAVATNIINATSSQVVTGTFTCQGNSASNRPLFRSGATPGVVSTITAAVVSLQDVDFQDITGAGAASPFTGTRLGDCKGNSGITFTAAANKYWVNDSSTTWTAANSWATSSGGAGATNNYPLPQDTAIFDANSFSVDGRTITISNQERVGSIDASAVDQAFTINQGAVCFGNVVLSASVALSGTVDWIFSGRGAQTITSAGITWPTGITIDSFGGTVTLNDALDLAGQLLGLTRGTFDMNGMAVSAGSFSSSNTNTRSITSGGATLTLTGNNATIYSTSTATGLTLNDALQVNCTYSGAAGVRIVTNGTNAAAAPNVSFTAGTDTVTALGAKNLDMTGFAGTLDLQGVTVYGSLTLSAGLTLSTGAFVLTFGATSGTNTITSSGKTFDQPVTFNGVGGTWRPADPLTLGSTRTLTLTNGHFDMNGVAVSAGLFSSNSSNTRSITSGGATLTLTGNNATIWNTGTSTNFALNDALQVDCTYSGAVGTRTTSGFLADGKAPSFNFSAGTDTVVVDGVKNLDFTGFAGTMAGSVGPNCYGSLLLSTGMTVASGIAGITFAASSGSHSITTNGKTIDRPVFFDAFGGAAGGTYQLVDALTVGSSRTTQLSRGTLDLNGNTLSTGNFSSNNSNARAITFGNNGKIVTTNVGAATVFNCATSTNLTVNRTGGSIEIGGNTTNTRTFAGGSQTWPSVTFTNTTPNGRLDFEGSNTLKSLGVSVAPQTINFTAGTTTTIEDENGFPSGTAGNLVTIGSITAANHSLAKAGGGRIASNYLSISRSQASPGNTWYAGTTSTDGGNNSGWNFTDPPSFPTGMMAAFRP